MLNGFSIVVFRTKKDNDNFRNVFIDRYRDYLINGLLFAQSALLRNDWTIIGKQLAVPMALHDLSSQFTWLILLLIVGHSSFILDYWALRKFIKASSQELEFCCENTYHLLPESEVITEKS